MQSFVWPATFGLTGMRNNFPKLMSTDVTQLRIYLSQPLASLRSMFRDAPFVHSPPPLISLSISQARRRARSARWAPSARPRAKDSAVSATPVRHHALPRPGPKSPTPPTVLTRCVLLAGKFSNSTGETGCFTCPIGSYSLAGYSNCVPCNAGSYIGVAGEVHDPAGSEFNSQCPQTAFLVSVCSRRACRARPAPTRARRAARFAPRAKQVRATRSTNRKS